MPLVWLEGYPSAEAAAAATQVGSKCGLCLPHLRNLLANRSAKCATPGHIANSTGISGN